MPRGRPKTRSDREINLSKLWNKLARSTFAIVDYDVYLHKYKPVLSDSEVKKLKKACSIAVDAALQHKR